MGRLNIKQRTRHLRLFAANPTRKPNTAANSADATVLGNKKSKKWTDLTIIKLADFTKKSASRRAKTNLKNGLCSLKGLKTTFALKLSGREKVQEGNVKNIR